MKVDLREWLKENWLYVTYWVSMGLVLLWLVARELGIYLIPLIAPFVPSLIYIFIRMNEELSKEC